MTRPEGGIAGRGDQQFAILGEDFTEAAAELIPTLKLRRHVIMEQCANQIAALYDDRASWQHLVRFP